MKRPCVNAVGAFPSRTLGAARPKTVLVNVNNATAKASIKVNKRLYQYSQLIARLSSSTGLVSPCFSLQEQQSRHPWRHAVGGLLCGVISKRAPSDLDEGDTSPRGDRASQFQRAIVAESSSLNRQR